MNIASLARKYESNGDPACVSSGKGDIGGVSYGLYQFSSSVGVVDDFVEWLCRYPDDALANYGRVLAVHAVNSDEFKSRWHELGTIDPGNFGQLQDEYIIAQYYDMAVSMLAKEGFHADRHSDALKAVILSRAVQNGPTGCVNLFKIAGKKINLNNTNDEQIICAIYDYLIVECDLARPADDGIWHSPDDFCHGSKNIILSLRRRFINERADALAMLTEE